MTKEYYTSVEGKLLLKKIISYENFGDE